MARWKESLALAPYLIAPETDIVNGTDDHHHTDGRHDDSKQAKAVPSVSTGGHEKQSADGETNANAKYPTCMYN